MFGDEVFMSWERCSARDFTAAFDALYAGLDPGGLVIPCLEPVITMVAGDELACRVGKKVESPLTIPNMLVLYVLSY